MIPYYDRIKPFKIHFSFGLFSDHLVLKKSYLIKLVVNQLRFVSLHKIYK